MFGTSTFADNPFADSAIGTGGPVVTAEQVAMPLSPAPRSIRFSGRTVTGSSQSVFTLEEEIFEHLGNQWQMEIEMPPMSRAQAAVWKGWGLGLYGRRGSFLLGDPAARVPLGSALGDPIVSGAQNARSKVLATRGWTSGSLLVLKTGDMIQLGNGPTSRLHMVLEDVSADSTGRATIKLWPRLRDNYADGDAITLEDCVGLFRLTEDFFGWTVDTDHMYGFTFTAVEVV